MAISKNDLVGLKSRPLYFDGLDLDWELGLVVRGPYEDSLKGAPAWEAKFDVPEVNKLFFFLDDDNNFAPNLMHHSA